MPSITTWTRLEPRPRSEDLAPALEARVYDPAWLLARQWQVAEFRGHDAAFPVRVDYRIATEPLLDDLDTPLPLVPLDLAAAEPPSSLTTAEAAEAGAELVTQLREAGCPDTLVTALVTAYPLLTADPSDGALTTAAGQSYLRLLRGRVPDARAATPDLSAAVSSGQLPPALAGATADPVTALHAIASWLSDGTDQVDRHGFGVDNWQPDQLDYRYAAHVAAGASRREVVAPTWGGEPPDWSDLDVTDAGGAAGIDSAAAVRAGSSAANLLTYPGMPDHRWWAFEDGRVNLARLDLGVTDVARMLVVEFAGLFSNDWYMQPVDLPLGSLNTVVELVVTDSHKRARALRAADEPSSPRAGAPGFALFSHTWSRNDTPAGTASGLLLPPASVASQRSGPLETVVLLRDDTADLGWALEVLVESDDGEEIDRVAAANERRPPPVASPPDRSVAQYRLETTVDPYQFPLVPSPEGAPVYLVVNPPVGTRNDTVVYPSPLGLLLPASSSGIRQEELPREGMRLSRHAVVTRSFDGAVARWTVRNRYVVASSPAPRIEFDGVD